VPGVQPPVILLRSADHLTQGSAVGLARRESLSGVRRAEDGRAGIDRARSAADTLTARQRCRLIPEQPHPYPPFGAAVEWRRGTAVSAQISPFCRADQVRPPPGKRIDRLGLDEAYSFP